MADILRVLYVDDEPDLLEIGRIFLEKDGAFAVDTLTSAREALLQLNTERYDAIISDYLMPEMDGIIFLRQLKASGNTTPFIIFTGRGREEVVIEALNEGAAFYLQKGGQPESQFAELAHKIQSAVSRQRIEKLAKDTERRLYDITNFLPDATFAIDRDGEVIAWNWAIEEMTGIPAWDMLGRGNYEYSIPFYGDRLPILIDYVSFPDEELTHGRYAIIKKEGDILIAETKLPRPLGRFSVLHGKASPLYNDEGDVIGAIESIRDITEQKQAEELLSESENKFSTIFRSSPVALTLVSAMDGIFVDVNDTFVRSTGYSREEVIGVTTEALGIFVDRNEREQLASSVRNNRTVQDMEIMCRTKAGEVRNCLFSSSIILIGKKPHIFSSINDITGRKQLEAALQESEERYRSLYVGSKDAVMIVSASRGFIAANPATIQLFGCSDEQDFMSRNPASLSPEYQPDGALSTDKSVEMMRLAMENGSHFFEWTHRRIDGTDFQATVLLSRFDSGGRQLVQATIRDITERKRAEEAFRQASRKLKLLSGITRHDITNQLTVLQGYLKILEKKQLDPSLKVYFEKVATAAHRISAMIRFTKEYEEIGVKAPAWQDCGSLVDTAAKEIPPGMVRVQNDLPAGEEVFADPLISRVFYNLMDNAVRYGGKITIIRFFVEDSTGDHILVCEDDGEGIADGEKERIFERGVGKNTGLGLALSREILDISGISITETGEPGKGARFEMTIPEGTWRKRQVTDGR
jgi:PAS domain S-box-containing protein